MIEIIKNWCEGIIIAIIICIIIELLIPEGKNKKYVKVVMGIYIVFTIINPLLKFINYDYDFYEFFGTQVEETYSEMDSNIKDVYVIGMEESLKQEIENLGYIINYVKIKVDKNYENIEQIELQVNSKKEGNTIIEPIIIGENSNKENESYEDIISFLKENYLVNDSQIIFR